MPEVVHNQLPSALDPESTRMKANRTALLALLASLRAEEDTIRLGGGAKAIDAQHNKGRLTVRERLNLLLDAPADFLELGLWAAHDMYTEYGGAPAAGVVTGLGRVAGRLCMVIANDATVKAGAFFPMTAKKVLRAQTIALDNRIPTLYLVDSAGVFLPLQEDVFPDTDDFGRIFRNNAVMSSMGIPQITAIMGMCVAGGAYLPVMTDTVLMTEGSGLFLAGPSLVQAAIGQKTDPEELGGAAMHAEISGTVDFKEPNDHLCIARLRSLVEKIGQRPAGSASAHASLATAEVFSRIPYDPATDAPLYPADDLYGLINPDPSFHQSLRHARGHRSPRRQQRSSTSTKPTSAAPFSAATRASAATPSASSPTRRSIRCRPSPWGPLPAQRKSKSAASSTPRAHKKPLASSWTAIRT